MLIEKPKQLVNPEPQSVKTDFRYFSVNKDDINDSINRSVKSVNRQKQAETLKVQEFGVFGVFRSPKSKFARTSADEGSPGQIQESDPPGEESISSASRGPRIGTTQPKLLKKYEDSSVKIYNSEFISNDNSQSKPVEFKSDETTEPSGKSDHLKVLRGRPKRAQENESKESFGSLKGSMLSEIFCLDTKKKPVPPSKFSQKMKNNTRFIAMIINKQKKHSSLMRSRMVISESSLMDTQHGQEQKNAVIYFFKSLVRLSRIFLEKLDKPKHGLKCLLFLEKNHQVDMTDFSDSLLKSSRKERKHVQHYLRVMGSSDSIEDYIRETKNKVRNSYSSAVDKTSLLPQQASVLFLLLGKAYLRLQEHSKAEEKLVVSHVYDRSNFDSLYLLAQMNFRLKNFRRAERFYRKAYLNNPRDNQALLGVAECNLREKNFDFLAHFSKSLDFECIHSARVCLLISTCLLELLSKSNRYPTNHNKDLYYLLLKFLKKAVDCLETDTFESPAEEAKLRNQVAQKYFKIKEFQAGIDCLTHLPEPTMTPLTLYNLAYAYFKTGNLSLSMDFLNRNLQAKPFHAKSLLLKAEISKKRGDLKTSQNILQRLLEKTPMDPVINRMLGDVFKFKGSFFQAIEHYEVILTRRRFQLIRTTSNSSSKSKS